VQRHSIAFEAIISSDRARQLTLAVIDVVVDLPAPDACLLLCADLHHRNFYRDIEKRVGAVVRSFIPRGPHRLLQLGFVALFGRPALVKIDRPELAESIFQEISAQAHAAVLVASEATISGLMSSESFAGNEDPIERVSRDPRHLIFEVDEDVSNKDEVLVRCRLGPECAEPLRILLAEWQRIVFAMK
jgi:hypothetical protein